MQRPSCWYQDDLDEALTGIREAGGDVLGLSPNVAEQQRQKLDALEMLRAEDIAACIVYAITQPKRCGGVALQMRTDLQRL